MYRGQEKRYHHNKIWLIFQLTTFDYAYLYRLCCDDLRKQILKMKNYNIEIREFDHYVGYDGRGMASLPIGIDQGVWCVASTLTFGLGCGHCFGICSTVELCRFCVLSLHREVGGVRQYTL